MTSINVVKSLSLASVLFVLFLEAWLVYVQRLHLTYSSVEVVFLPLFLMGVSLIVTFLFLVHLKFSPLSAESVKNPKGGLRQFFQVYYMPIREMLREKTYIAIALATAFSYALVFSLAQGLLIQASLGPYFKIISEGLPGYAPIFIFFPVKGFGFVVSAYQLAVLVCLSLFTGVSMAVFSRVYKQRRELSKHGLGLSLVGASAGLLVTCPTCVTPPIMILLSTLLLPLTGSLASSILGEVAQTTVVYSLSLFLLLIGLSSSSRALQSGYVCQIKTNKT